MRHRKIKKILPLFVLGELDHSLSAEVRHHLEGCSACRWDLSSLKSLLEKMEKQPVPVLNSFVFEKTKRLAKDRLRRKEISSQEKRHARIVVLVSLFSWLMSVFTSVVVFQIASPVFPWPFLKNFPVFFFFWWVILTFLSLMTSPVILKIKQTYIEEIKNDAW